MGINDWFLVTSIGCLIVITLVISRCLHNIRKNIELATRNVDEQTSSLNQLIKDLK